MEAAREHGTPTPTAAAPRRTRVSVAAAPRAAPASPGLLLPAGPPPVRLGPTAMPPAHVDFTGPLGPLIASPRPGAPLLPAVRAPLEGSLGIDLEPVRVHDDSQATRVVDSLPARA